MNRAIRPVAAVAAVAAGLFGLSTNVSAATRVTTVTGSMSITEESCLQALVVSVGTSENCMYDGGPSNDPSGSNWTPVGEVTGPYNHIAFYDSVTTPAAFQTTIVGSARVLYAPVDGDGKISQRINGTVTIDDAGNGFGADDLISFTVTLTSPGTGAIIRHLSGSTAIDKYDSMTQVLAPTAVNSVAANGFGGLDYVIGVEGFPTLLTYSQAGPCLGLLFGNVECGHSFTALPGDPDFWSGASAAGLGSLESNTGAKTTGTVANLQCIDSKSATGVESNGCLVSQVSYHPWLVGPCAVTGGCTGNAGTGGSIRGAAEDVGWDQLLLKVSTNAVGSVVAVAGFNVDEFRIFFQVRCGDNTTGTGNYSAVCNTWTSGYFTAQSADSDGDGIQNSLDNCSGTANPTQLDTNGDGYGNICDPDLNNSGLVTATDFNILRSVLNAACPAPANTTACNADLNGSGLVTATDFNILRARINTAPGPSGLH